MASVFSKIILGELPAYKVHEDDATFSFLALDQVNPGHVLVVPKQEVDHWIDATPELLTRVTLTGQKIASAIQQATGCVRVCSIIAGFEVPHLHVHLIPTWDLKDLDFQRARRLPPQEMQAVQQRIIDALSV
jgi:histidine triad (HIT) family protein